jgi:hypothetical protein
MRSSMSKYRDDAKMGEYDEGRKMERLVDRHPLPSLISGAGENASMR